MQTALLLESLKTGVPIAIVVIHQGTAGMPISHRGVALLKEGV